MVSPEAADYEEGEEEEENVGDKTAGKEEENVGDNTEEDNQNDNAEVVAAVMLVI